MSNSSRQQYVRLAVKVWCSHRRKEIVQIDTVSSLFYTVRGQRHLFSKKTITKESKATGVSLRVFAARAKINYVWLSRLRRTRFDALIFFFSLSFHFVSYLLQAFKAIPLQIAKKKI